MRPMRVTVQPALAAAARTAASCAGAAVNSGLISALRASVTITGKEVTHTGAIDSSTSVSLNGRIDLKAHYNAASVNGSDSQVPFLFRESGIVTLGSGFIVRGVSLVLAENTTVIGLPAGIRDYGNNALLYYLHGEGGGF